MIIGKIVDKIEDLDENCICPIEKSHAEARKNYDSDFHLLTEIQLSVLKNWLQQLNPIFSSRILLIYNSCSYSFF